MSKARASRRREPDGRLLGREHGCVPEHADQKRPVAARGLEELADDVVDVRHRLVVRLELADPQVDGLAERLEPLP